VGGGGGGDANFYNKTRLLTVCNEAKSHICRLAAHSRPGRIFKGRMVDKPKHFVSTREVNKGGHDVDHITLCVAKWVTTYMGTTYISHRCHVMVNRT
jgi:hypothetical protein